MLPMPSPTINRPSRLSAGTADSQNKGKPANATHKVTSRRIPPDSQRARRLPRIRPASMATKKTLSAVAAVERPRPTPFSRKSAPQYATHHSTETPRNKTPKETQKRIGSADEALPDVDLSVLAWPSGSSRKRAARNTSAATGRISATRQPNPKAAKTPTARDARIAQALAATLDSVMATALHSPYLSASIACVVMRSRPPQVPMTNAPSTVPGVTGLAPRSSAPAAMPAPPPQRLARRPQRPATRSPKKPTGTAPRANALKCRLATV